MDGNNFSSLANVAVAVGLILALIYGLRQCCTPNTDLNKLVAPYFRGWLKYLIYPLFVLGALAALAATSAALSDALGLTEPKIVAVLDWELSTLGDGLADLGYLCQEYHGESYEDEGLTTVDFETSGIPREEEFVAHYCQHAGRDGIDNWHFYLIYNMFRSAAIIQGVYKRGLDGNASSEKALEYKDHCKTRSARAVALLDQYTD